MWLHVVTPLVVASTFSGVGGSCLGYRMAGFEVRYANEFNPAAAAAHHRNFPDCVLDQRDVREVQASEVLEALGLVAGQLDVFDGSPPCQAFSLLGSREEGWGATGREDLGREYVRLLAGLQPRAFVMENVKSLTTGKARGYWVELAKAFRAAGYRFEAKILKAEWFGVPSTRQRLIVIGFRNDVPCAISWPKPWPKLVAIRDVCPEIERLVTREFGKGGRAAPLHQPAPCVAAQGIGAGWRTQADCTIGGVRQPIPLDVIRRLCSFPDDFQPFGDRAEQWRGYGNAVPPLLMKAVAESVRDVLLTARAVAA